MRSALERGVAVSRLLLSLPACVVMTSADSQEMNSAQAGQDLMPITDFTSATPDLGWYVVNDNVMGGRSEGGFDVDNGELHFGGRTNTDGGGFSSIRTGDLGLDLSRHSGMRLRVRGDGRRYTWRLTTDARWRGQPIGYWADFDTEDSRWQEVDIPFSRFAPQVRGMALDGPQLDTSRIAGMGLMIYDKRDGPFAIRIDSVAAYAARAPFRLESLRWKYRVLVLAAPGADDDDLERLRRELAATAEEFSDRDLLLIELIEDGSSSVAGDVLSAEDAAALRKALGIRSGTFGVRLIGKDGSVKLEGARDISIVDIYSLIDMMPMRQRESERN